jgi:hypothetical protein
MRLMNLGSVDGGFGVVGAGFEGDGVSGVGEVGLFWEHAVAKIVTRPSTIDHRRVSLIRALHVCQSPERPQWQTLSHLWNE